MPQEGDNQGENEDRKQVKQKSGKVCSRQGDSHCKVPEGDLSMMSLRSSRVMVWQELSG